jgi:sulfate transport system ATP-binding protein
VSIEIRNVTKAYGTFAAVNDVSFTVGGGELFALLGPSGSGKTTLLRVIAGLETPDRGTVLLDNEDATDRNVRDRGVGFVFQHYALFRHLTVFENVAFGLRVRPRARRPSNAEITERVQELLKLVQLDYLWDRYPAQLSGGQRQRVALARALAVEPKVLLLDEPFGALDANVRRELRRWLRRLHDEIRLTSVFVTHDQEEAFELADRVVIMNKGRIEQEGRPDEVLEHPATPFIMNFLGHVNMFPGRVEDGKVQFGAFTAELPAEANGAESVSAYARPHELDVSRTDTGGGLWTVVHQVNRAGGVVRLELRAVSDNQPVQVEIARETFADLAFVPGDRVYVTLRRVKIFATDHTSPG